MPEPSADGSDKNLRRRIRRYSLILLVVVVTLFQFVLSKQEEVAA